MAFVPQTIAWPGERAVLLVHGIGNAKPGDYAPLAASVRASLGTEGPTTAIYELYYDVFNDWLNQKTAFSNKLGKLTSFMRLKEPDTAMADQISEFAGDIIWPLFSTAARATVRLAYISQLHQMVLDGMNATGKVPGQLHFSIVCHSLGCFHTYEVLHAIASDPASKLQPFTDGLTFRSVVFMASPVQFLRTLGTHVKDLVPKGLFTVDLPGVAIPAEFSGLTPHSSVTNWVSVTGDLDPVGGHFLHQKAAWAYMDVPAAAGVTQIVDPQVIGAGTDDRGDLITTLAGSLVNNDAPKIQIDNPHSWQGYVDRHQADLKTWLTA